MFSFLSLSQENFIQCHYGMLANFKKGKDRNLLVQLRMSLYIWLRAPLRVTAYITSWKNMLKDFSDRWVFVNTLMRSNGLKITQKGYVQCCIMSLSLGQYIWHAWKLACIFRWFDLSFTKSELLNIKECMGDFSMLIIALSMVL